MALPYEDLIIENKNAFIAKVNDVAKQLSIPPEWLAKSRKIINQTHNNI